MCTFDEPTCGWCGGEIVTQYMRSGYRYCCEQCADADDAHAAEIRLSKKLTKLEARVDELESQNAKLRGNLDYWRMRAGA